MENNTWIIALAVIAVVAIVAVFGMVNMTGYAIRGDMIEQEKLHGPCYMISENCETNCAYRFACSMEKCREIVRTVRPADKSTEMQYCVGHMQEDYQRCLDECNLEEIGVIGMDEFK